MLYYVSFSLLRLLLLIFFFALKKRGGAMVPLAGPPSFASSVQGVLKKEHVEIPGSMKKEEEFPVVFKKKSCGISIGLGF